MTTLALTGASLEKFATEIRALQKTEVRELEEPFARGPEGLVGHAPQAQPGRGCEQVTGLARLLRGNALAALENVALWHERDISHSSVERVIVPDSFLALDHMLRRMTEDRERHDASTPSACAATSTPAAASSSPASSSWS